MFVKGLLTGFFASGSAIFAFNRVGGYSIRRVEGPSMSPTLNPEGSGFRDIVLVKQVEGDHFPPLGSIVTISHPRKPNLKLIKRLGSRPDGQEVPEGHYWITSDAGSGRFLDSWVLGPIPEDKIFGRALWIIFPFNRIKKLD